MIYNNCGARNDSLVHLCGNIPLGLFFVDGSKVLALCKAFGCFSSNKRVLWLFYGLIQTLMSLNRIHTDAFFALFYVQSHRNNWAQVADW